MKGRLGLCVCVCVCARARAHVYTVHVYSTGGRMSGVDGASQAPSSIICTIHAPSLHRCNITMATIRASIAPPQSWRNYTPCAHCFSTPHTHMHTQSHPPTPDVLHIVHHETRTAARHCDTCRCGTSAPIVTGIRPTGWHAELQHALHAQLLEGCVCKCVCVCVREREREGKRERECVCGCAYAWEGVRGADTRTMRHVSPCAA